MTRWDFELDGVSATPVMKFDLNRQYFAATILVVPDGGTYTIEATLDDVWAAGFDPATALWYTLVADLTTVNSLALSPYMGLRVRQTVDGAGPTIVQMVQTGI